MLKKQLTLSLNMIFLNGHKNIKKQQTFNSFESYIFNYSYGIQKFNIIVKIL